MALFKLTLKWFADKDVSFKISKREMTAIGDLVEKYIDQTKQEEIQKDEAGLMKYTFSLSFTSNA